VDLEVQVRHAAMRVTGVAHEPEHVSGLYRLPGDGER
jgi:hypothetical protein